MLARHCRCAGFTLVELLITVAVLAILLTIGAPEMRNFVMNGRIRATAESIMDGLQLARAEAVRRNTNVQFSLAGAAWTVTQGTQTIQSKAAAEGGGQVTVTTNSGTTAVTFNALGRIPGFSSTANLSQIDIDMPTSVLPAAASREMRIVIFPGGQIRLCDPNVTTTGDPRRC